MVETNLPSSMHLHSKISIVLFIYVDIVSPGGGTLNFFGGCVPRVFQNVGSRERIFLEKWGSWEQKFEKIWV